MCFGPCPVYSVRVYADGTVIYRGDWHVHVRGGRRTQLSPSALEALRDAFRRSAFLSLQYQCGSFHTDDSTVSLYYAERGDARVVEHNHGCDGAPPGLTVLEDQIDRITETGRWIGVGHVIGDPADVEAMDHGLQVPATGAER